MNSSGATYAKQTNLLPPTGCTGLLGLPSFQRQAVPIGFDKFERPFGIAARGRRRHEVGHWYVWLKVGVAGAELTEREVYDWYVGRSVVLV